jgi:hypothetical protein
MRKPTEHVTFVGGHDRVEREIVPFGARLGLVVEVHNGQTRGNGADRLIALVRRTDLVVIVTGTNSHGAVHIAKREAAKSGARVRILKSCGAGTARALLAELAQASAARNRGRAEGRTVRNNRRDRSCSGFNAPEMSCVDACRAASADRG